MTEPTIEELQKQIAELKESNEAQKTQIENLTKQNTENSSNLKQARELNTKLLLHMNVSGEKDTAKEESEDTIESLVDEIVTKTNENYLKRYSNGN